MSEPQAPREWTPEYCNSMVGQVKSALDSAVKTLETYTSGQEKFTAQALTHIKESLDDGTKNFDLNSSEHKLLKDDIKSLRNTVYGGAITGIIFYIISEFALIKYLLSVAAEYHGGK